MTQISQADQPSRSALSKEVTEVSDALHARHGHVKTAFLPVFLIEVCLTLAGLIGLASGSFLLKCLGFVALAASLQPVLKVSTGLLLGVRYSYAYLWYFEPRFKMAYGSYILQPSRNRIIIHLVGSTGTPLAFLAGAVSFAETPPLSALCIVGFLGTFAMQAAAYVARRQGIMRIGKFSLSQLTTPAMLAEEVMAARKTG
jgi:hypothetical protein